MADYLQMDGIDDFIVTPSITFNRVLIDAYIHYRTSGAWNCIVSGTSSQLTYNTGGGQSSSGYNTPPIINGSGSYSIPQDTRSTIDITTTAATVTNVEYLFSNLGTSDFTQANVYNVKFYNGATLVAHYDMTTGTVQDQSGNGKHATLTGGTWVGGSSSVAGGGTLTGTGSLTASGRNNISKGGTLTGLGSLTASGRNNIAGGASLTGNGSLSASGRNNISGSSSMQGAGTLTISGVVSTSGPISGSASLQGVGTLTASGTVSIAGGATLQGVGTIVMLSTIIGGATLTGVGTLTVSGVAGAEIINTVTLYADQETTVTLSASEELTVNLYALTLNSVTLDGGP